MQPATARPFVSRRPPQSSPPPELEAAGGPIHSASPADDTHHNRPTAHSTAMLVYLTQEGQGEIIKLIFQATKDSDDLREEASRRVPYCESLDHLTYCWRFLAGHGAYFGPVPYAPLTEASDADPYLHLQMGPGSVWLDPQAQCASWEQPEVAESWEQWNMEERNVYTDVRTAALAVAEQWFTANGHDADECCGSLEIRLMCARYASNAVERFRQWRKEVLK